MGEFIKYQTLPGFVHHFPDGSTTDLPKDTYADTMAFVQDRVQKHPIEHEVVDNSILTAFQEAKSAVEGHVSYTNKVVSYHRSFPKFCELPAEIREMVMHEYLLSERDAGRLRQNRHRCSVYSDSCTWNYPEAFVACEAIPKPEIGRFSEGWLPNLGEPPDE